MYLRDTLLMSPWEKWEKHRRFPWKIIIHTLIVIVLSVTIILIVSQYGEYSYNTNATFQTMFYPTGFADGIYTVDDCVQAINQTVLHHQKIIENSVDRYLHSPNANSTEDQHVTMSWTRYLKPFFNRQTRTYYFENFGDISTVTESCVITIGNLGPLDGNSTVVKKFFEGLVNIRLNLTLDDLNVSLMGAVPFTWEVEVKTSRFLRTNIGVKI